MDELLQDDRTPRPSAQALWSLLEGLGSEELAARQAATELDILTMGITFTVYSDGENIDRAWPFDVVPRIISGDEWNEVEQGLAQRLRAVNMFIDDLYNDQRIIADGVFPAELLAESVNFRPECRGASPKYGVWAHISGSDLVRDDDGTMYVLEDNLRVPSGVSYVIENRAVTKRAFPELFGKNQIRPVDSYTDELNKLLNSLAPDGVSDPTLAVLTPGIFNSAYFEHSFLAQRMGAELVEGGDLVVGDDDCVYMHTVDGRDRVHVIYRRIDDLFLDPEVFRPDSLLGVPGLMRAWKAGNVGIANAPGAGVADDKCVYAWMPDIIRYYLGEEPRIANVPTYRCMYDDEREYVLDHLDELVMKPANESGGYGITIGSRASEEELAACAASILEDPRNWVAQPIINLSTVPTLIDGELHSRHVDLRPFILTGETSFVTSGGLTRVALKEGSLIVNSSQGGGSKDTWIVDVPQNGFDQSMTGGATAQDAMMQDTVGAVLETGAMNQDMDSMSQQMDGISQQMEPMSRHLDGRSNDGGHTVQAIPEMPQQAEADGAPDDEPTPWNGGVS